jgi:hypothetical protein
MVASSSDEYANAQYLKALDEISTEERARYLDGAREAYWKRYGRDIERISDLLDGPSPILKGLPRAHSHFDGFEWYLDPKTGQVTSSYYKARYRLHVTPSDRSRQERWRSQKQSETRSS